MSYFTAYLSNGTRDFLRFNRLCGAAAAQVLRLQARRARGNPARRLQLLARAARICPSVSGRDRLYETLRAELRQLDVAAIDWPSVGLAATNRTEIPKGIILKPPISTEEKGLLCIHFEEQWLRLLRSPHVAEIARRYDLLLGPSSSPPPDLELLLAVKMWPGRLFTLLSNFEDASTMRRLSDRLIPIQLLASSWVDPAGFTPYLGKPKDLDIVMVANFGRFKRHWLFFNALRRLPTHYRVRLLGVPMCGRSERDLREEAHAFGVADRFELIVRPTRAQLMESLCRARVSLIFSGLEGSCIAVTESLFADTPVGLFRNARIGSKAFINSQTGVLLERCDLAGQLRRFVETAADYRPRAWAVENVSCQHSSDVLNALLRQTTLRKGRPWTRDLEVNQNALVPTYVTAETEVEMRPWYEDFERRYRLRIGSAGPAVSVTEKPNALASVG
jgi:glycosyltransferase involved in cell wall biosynthesis